jgi:hypothetical protein
MPINAADLFSLWAPQESPWSVWAKPVLFAEVGAAQDLDYSLPVPSPENFPRPPGTAAVVDLDGTDSILYGLALLTIGYRPVPLFNGTVAPSALVDMRVIQNFLGFGAGALRQARLSPDAPPVFLMNADRLDNKTDASKPGRYDNRWCVVPQDMPSAEFLRDHAITQIALVAQNVMDDLAHVLRRYQDAGLPISRTPDFGTPLAPIEVARPKFYKSLIERFEVSLGLRRNAAGGFGAVVPEPSSGGGFG